MDRRRYLGIVGTIVTGPLAGCNSNTEDNSPSNTSELSVGDSAIKDGTFRITVLKTRRLSQLDDEYGTTTPSPQAAFFAIKIRAEHIGETEEDYPETDTIGAVNIFVCVYPQQITRRRKGSTDTTIQCFTDVISAIPTPSVGSRNYR